MEEYIHSDPLINNFAIRKYKKLKSLDIVSRFLVQIKLTLQNPNKYTQSATLNFTKHDPNFPTPKIQTSQVTIVYSY